MGWISKRCHETGHSIGTGPRGGKHKGPLRDIMAVIHPGRGLFDTDWVLMSCGHEGRSYGGVRARCGKCGRSKPEEAPA